MSAVIEPDSRVMPLHTVLYVEDDPDIRYITGLALTELGGFNLCSCESGADALSKAVEFRPDLLLLDVMMPGMDGMQTLTALRELPHLAQTPVVFMTARVQAQDLASYRALGAIGVVQKPFEPMTLAERLHALWRDWQRLHC